MAAIAAMKERERRRLRYAQMSRAQARHPDEEQMVVKSLSVPPGLEALMESLTKEILKVQPEDICMFAADHFAKLIQLREKVQFCKISNKLLCKDIPKGQKSPKLEVELIKGDNNTLSVPPLDFNRLSAGEKSPIADMKQRSEASTAEIDKIHAVGFFDKEQTDIDEIQHEIDDDIENLNQEFELEQKEISNFEKQEIELNNLPEQIKEVDTELTNDLEMGKQLDELREEREELTMKKEEEEKLITLEIKEEDDATKLIQTEHVEMLIETEKELLDTEKEVKNQEDIIEDSDKSTLVVPEISTTVPTPSPSEEDQTLQEVEEELRHQAATKIQSAWRGHNSRNLQQPQNEKEEIDDELNRAATKIQSVWKGFSYRRNRNILTEEVTNPFSSFGKNMPELMAAATNIQSAWRGFNTRKSLQDNIKPTAGLVANVKDVSGSKISVDETSEPNLASEASTVEVTDLKDLKKQQTESTELEDLNKDEKESSKLTLNLHESEEKLNESSNLVDDLKKVVFTVGPYDEIKITDDPNAEKMAENIVDDITKNAEEQVNKIEQASDEIESDLDKVGHEIIDEAEIIKDIADIQSVRNKIGLQHSGEMHDSLILPKNEENVTEDTKEMIAKNITELHDVEQESKAIEEIEHIVQDKQLLLQHSGEMHDSLVLDLSLIDHLKDTAEEVKEEIKAVEQVENSVEEKELSLQNSGDIHDSVVLDSSLVDHLKDTAEEVEKYMKVVEQEQVKNVDEDKKLSLQHSGEMHDSLVLDPALIDNLKDTAEEVKEEIKVVEQVENVIKEKELSLQHSAEMHDSLVVDPALIHNLKDTAEEVKEEIKVVEQVENVIKEKELSLQHSAEMHDSLVVDPALIDNLKDTAEEVKEEIKVVEQVENVIKEKELSLQNSGEMHDSVVVNPALIDNLKDTAEEVKEEIKVVEQVENVIKEKELSLQNSGEMHDSLVVNPALIDNLKDTAEEVKEEIKVVEQVDNVIKEKELSLQNSGEIHEPLLIVDVKDTAEEVKEEIKVLDQVENVVQEKQLSLQHSGEMHDSLVLDHVQNTAEEVEKEIKVVEQVENAIKEKGLSLQHSGEMHDSLVLDPALIDNLKDTSEEVKEEMKVVDQIENVVQEKLSLQHSGEMHDSLVLDPTMIDHLKETAEEVQDELKVVEQVEKTVQEKELSLQHSGEMHDSLTLPNFVPDSLQETIKEVEKENNNVEEIQSAVEQVEEEKKDVEEKKLSLQYSGEMHDSLILAPSILDEISSQINELNKNINDQATEIEEKTENFKENIEESVHNADNVLTNAEQELKNTVTELQKSVEDNINQTTDKLQNTISQSSEKLQNSADAIEETSDSIKEQIIDNVAQTTNEIEHSLQHATQSVEDISSAVVENEINYATETIQHEIQDTEETVNDIAGNIGKLQEDAQKGIEDIGHQTEISNNVQEAFENVNVLKEQLLEDASNKLENTKSEIADNIEDTKSKLTEDAAAIKIQSAWRGFNSRSNKQQNAHIQECDELPSQRGESNLDKAATTIQAGARGFLVRKRRQISDTSIDPDSMITVIEKTAKDDEDVVEKSSTNIEDLEKDLGEIKSLNERLQKLTTEPMEFNSSELKNTEVLSDDEVAEINKFAKGVNLDDIDSSRYDLKPNLVSPRSKTSSPIQELSNAALRIGAVFVNDSVLEKPKTEEKKNVEYIHIPLHGPVGKETVVPNPKPESVGDYIYIPLKDRTGLQHSGEMHDSLTLPADISDLVVSNTTHDVDVKNERQDMNVTEADGQESQLNTTHNQTNSSYKLQDINQTSNAIIPHLSQTDHDDYSDDNNDNSSSTIKDSENKTAVIATAPLDAQTQRDSSQVDEETANTIKTAVSSQKVSSSIASSLTSAIPEEEKQTYMPDHKEETVEISSPVSNEVQVPTVSKIQEDDSLPTEKKTSSLPHSVSPAVEQQNEQHSKAPTTEKITVSPLSDSEIHLDSPKKENVIVAENASPVLVATPRTEQIKEPPTQENITEVHTDSPVHQSEDNTSSPCVEEQIEAKTISPELTTVHTASPINEEKTEEPPTQENVAEVHTDSPVHQSEDHMSFQVHEEHLETDKASEEHTSPHTASPTNNDKTEEPPTQENVAEVHKDSQTKQSKDYTSSPRIEEQIQVKSISSELTTPHTAFPTNEEKTAELPTQKIVAEVHTDSPVNQSEDHMSSQVHEKHIETDKASEKHTISHTAFPTNNDKTEEPPTQENVGEVQTDSPVNHSEELTSSPRIEEQIEAKTISPELTSPHTASPTNAEETEEPPTHENITTSHIDSPANQSEDHTNSPPVEEQIEAKTISPELTMPHTASPINAGETKEPPTQENVAEVHTESPANQSEDHTSSPVHEKHIGTDKASEKHTIPHTAFPTNNDKTEESPTQENVEEVQTDSPVNHSEELTPRIEEQIEAKTITPELTSSHTASPTNAEETEDRPTHENITASHTDSPANQSEDHTNSSPVEEQIEAKTISPELTMPHTASPINAGETKEPPTQENVAEVHIDSPANQSEDHTSSPVHEKHIGTDKASEEHTIPHTAFSTNNDKTEEPPTQENVGEVQTDSPVNQSEELTPRIEEQIEAKTISPELTSPHTASPTNAEETEEPPTHENIAASHTDSPANQSEDHTNSPPVEEQIEAKTISPELTMPHTASPINAGETKEPPTQENVAEVHIDSPANQSEDHTSSPVHEKHIGTDKASEEHTIPHTAFPTNNDKTEESPTQENVGEVQTDSPVNHSEELTTSPRIEEQIEAKTISPELTSLHTASPTNAEETEEPPTHENITASHIDSPANQSEDNTNSPPVEEQIEAKTISPELTMRHTAFPTNEEKTAELPTQEIVAEVHTDSPVNQSEDHTSSPVHEKHIETDKASEEHTIPHTAFPTNNDKTEESPTQENVGEVQTDSAVNHSEELTSSQRIEEQIEAKTISPELTSPHTASPTNAEETEEPPTHENIAEVHTDSPENQTDIHADSSVHEKNVETEKVSHESTTPTITSPRNEERTEEAPTLKHIEEIHTDLLKNQTENHTSSPVHEEHIETEKASEEHTIPHSASPSNDEKTEELPTHENIREVHTDSPANQTEDHTSSPRNAEQIEAKTISPELTTLHTASSTTEGDETVEEVHTDSPENQTDIHVDSSVHEKHIETEKDSHESTTPNISSSRNEERTEEAPIIKHVEEVDTDSLMNQTEDHTSSPVHEEQRETDKASEELTIPHTASPTNDNKTEEPPTQENVEEFQADSPVNQSEDHTSSPRIEEQIEAKTISPEFTSPHFASPTNAEETEEPPTHENIRENHIESPVNQTEDHTCSPVHEEQIETDKESEEHTIPHTASPTNDNKTEEPPSQENVGEIQADSPVNQSEEHTSSPRIEEQIEAKTNSPELTTFHTASPTNAKETEDRPTHENITESHTGSPVHQTEGHTRSLVHEEHIEMDKASEELTTPHISPTSDVKPDEPSIPPADKTESNELNDSEEEKEITTPKCDISPRIKLDDIDSYLEKNKSRSSSHQSNSDLSHRKLFDEIDSIIKSYDEKRQTPPLTDHTKINDLPDTETVAATKIQSVYRGFKTRQDLKNASNERKNSSESNRTYTIGNSSPNNITSPEEISSDDEKNNLAKLEDKFLDSAVDNNNTDPKEELKELSELCHTSKPLTKHSSVELATIPEDEDRHSAEFIADANGHITRQSGHDTTASEDDEGDLETSGIQSESSMYEGDESDGKSSPDVGRRGPRRVAQRPSDSLDIFLSSEELSQGAEMLTSARNKAVVPVVDASHSDMEASGTQSSQHNSASPDNMSSETNAATKIQAGFRGYQVRKQIKLNKSSAEDGKTGKRGSGRRSDLEERSATKIQAGIRGFLVRKRQRNAKDKQA